MSFVFYDTETTGTHTAFDQILQFGAIRTDHELRELERFEIRCRLLPHVVPSPAALLTNGITVEQLTDPGAAEPLRDGAGHQGKAGAMVAGGLRGPQLDALRRAPVAPGVLPDAAPAVSHQHERQRPHGQPASATGGAFPGAGGADGAGGGQRPADLQPRTAGTGQRF